MKYLLAAALLLLVSCDSDSAANSVAADAAISDVNTTSDTAVTSDGGTNTDIGAADLAAGDTGVVDSGADTASVDMAVDVDLGPLGGDRPAKVVLPSDWSANGSYPVVVLLHGLTATADLQDQFFGASDLVDELQFVLVLPEGLTDSLLRQYWNATDYCCDDFDSGVDDSTYLMDLGEDAVARYAGDAKRLYYFGHSNGGYMSYRLACDHSEKIAGIASLAGSGWADEANCGTPSPVPVLQIHGTADAIVSYYGIGVPPGAQEMVDRWVARNGCVGGPVDGVDADYDSFVFGDETSKQVWSNCDAGTSVEFWTMTLSGHLPVVSQSDLTRDLLGFLFSHTLP